MNYKDYLRPGKTATDITPLFANAHAFNMLVDDLCQKFKEIRVDKVACIEARGFILGSAVAYVMKSGVVPIRKGGLQNETYSQQFIDYSGKEKELFIHQDAIGHGEKVVIIDDWLETGAAVKAAIHLIELCGGEVVGIGVFMDDSSEDTKKFLSKYNYHFIESVSPEEDKF